DGLWGLLACVTLRKCGKWRDHFRTRRRDVGREQPLPHLVDDLDTGPLAREPDPAEADLLHETLGLLLRDLNAQEQEITLLRLVEGLRPVEIARRLGCSQSKVSRVLSFVGSRLKRLALTAESVS